MLPPCCTAHYTNYIPVQISRHAGTGYAQPLTLSAEHVHLCMDRFLASKGDKQTWVFIHKRYTHKDDNVYTSCRSKTIHRQGQATVRPKCQSSKLNVLMWKYHLIWLSVNFPTKQDMFCSQMFHRFRLQFSGILDVFLRIHPCEKKKDRPPVYFGCVINKWVLNSLLLTSAFIRCMQSVGWRNTLAAQQHDADADEMLFLMFLDVTVWKEAGLGVKLSLSFHHDSFAKQCNCIKPSLSYYSLVRCISLSIISRTS